MNTHILSYDLVRPGKDYSNLITHLKSYTKWAKPLESVWLLKTSLTAEQVRNAAMTHVDTNDKLIVIDVTSRPAAWFKLPADVSAWIKSSL